MKNKKTEKPNLVKLSLEELKGINGGGSITLDEAACKTAKASEEGLKAPKTPEQGNKF